MIVWGARVFTFSVLFFIVTYVLFGTTWWKHSYSGRVVDDAGNPVGDAEVRLHWDAHLAGLLGALTLAGLSPGDPRDHRELTLRTDADGRFAFRAAGNLVSGKVQEGGYYGAWVSFQPNEPEARREIPVPLPRILRPRPVVGKKAKVHLPAGSSRLQYDFLAGDCLPPHGNGVVADLEIEWTRPEAPSGRGPFRGHLVGEGNGALYLPSPGTRFSGPRRLRSLHEAPAGGYQNTAELGSISRGGNAVFYLKIRSGQPGGPLYGKMLDPIGYWARQRVKDKGEDEFEFEYVINPSGDRGLEMDMDRISVPNRHASEYFEYTPEEF